MLCNQNRINFKQSSFFSFDADEHNSNMLNTTADTTLFDEGEHNSVPRASEAAIPEKRSKKKRTKYFYCNYVVDIDSPVEDVKEVVFDLIDCEKWNPFVDIIGLEPIAFPILLVFELIY